MVDGVAKVLIAGKINLTIHKLFKLELFKLHK